MFFRLLFLINFIALIGCKEDPPQPQLKFTEGKGTIAIGQTGLYYTKNDPIPLKIKLIKIISDSRCPEGAKCVWAGEISAEIMIDDKNHFMISSAETTQKPVVFRNKHVMITGANPYPKINVRINPKEYKVEFTVEEQ